MLFPEKHKSWDRDVDRLAEQVLDMGRKQLTSKQLAVVKLILNGKTDAEIQVALNMTPARIAWNGPRPMGGRPLGAMPSENRRSGRPRPHRRDGPVAGGPPYRFIA